MATKTCCAEVCRVVEKPREPVPVYYAQSNKKTRFSKRLADRALLHEDESNAQGEDWISLLPDDILVGILSLLNIKEAGRSSVLSQRWRYLWTFYTGKLEIEYKESPYYGDDISRKKHYVSKILKSHNQGSVLDELIIRFPVKVKQSRRIDRWINFASRKCFLRRFELDCSPRSFDWKYEELFKFPRIDRVLSKQHGGVVFSSLTSLCFTYVNVTVEAIAHLLAMCASLKELVVRQSSCLKFLELSGKGLKLESLEVYGCTFMEILTINNVDNLVSLRYDGKSLVVTNAPRLSKLMIGGKICSSLDDMSRKHFSSFIQHLECLKMDLPLEDFRNPPVSPQRLPVMYHLKHLELILPGMRKRTVLSYIRLIEACPLLSRFTIKDLCPCYRERPGIAGYCSDTDYFEHGSLKVVELLGFRDVDSDYELAFLLLKIAAVSIEKLIISLHPLFLKDRPKIVVRNLKNVREQLEAKLPNSAILVIP